MSSRLLKLALTFTFIIQSEETEPMCASVSACTCISVNWKPKDLLVDCSARNLSFIPNFNANVTNVDLSQNDISEIAKHVELPEGINHLNLSENKIKRLPKELFRNSKLLKSLNLATNQICFASRSVLNVFERLTNLQVLNLKNNCEIHKGRHFAEILLSKLPNLETLRIDGYAEFFHSASMATSANLKHLDFSGSSGNCDIPILRKNYFKPFAKLEVIDISHCNILRIEVGTFSHLRKLEYLDISFNEDLTFQVLENITNDLPNTSIQVFKANKIHRTFGIGNELFVADIKHINMTSLREFHLDSNRLELIDPWVCDVFPTSLELISIADNKLTMGDYMITLQNLPVNILNISYQHSAHNPSEVRKPVNMQSCDRNYRRMCPNVVESSMTSSRENRVPKWTEKSIFEMIPISAYVKQFHFRKSMLKFSVQEIKFLPNNSLEYLDVSGNNIYEWNGPVRNVDNLQYLDLSDNRCLNLSTVFFNNMKSLKTLNIAGNEIGATLKTDNNGDIFHGLWQLESLNISRNRIPALHQNIFKKLPNLEILNISFNVIRTWEFLVDHMKNLKLIDMTNNELTFISKSVRDDLDKLAGKANLSINLESNLFECDCSSDTRDFLLWFEKSPIEFINLDNYKCRQKDGSEDTVHHVKDAESFLSSKCTQKQVILISKTAAPFVFLCVVSIICFLKRWKIRTRYYQLKMIMSNFLTPVNTARNGYRAIEGSDKYSFEVFFIYSESDNDYEFVAEAVRQFENGDIRICFRERDFQIGNSYFNCMEQAVQISKKTFIVLSKKYLKEHVCDFQFDLALTAQSLREGKSKSDMLFLIEKESGLTNIPLKYYKLKSENKYLDYPSESDEQQVFWTMLRKEVLR